MLKLQIFLYTALDSDIVFIIFQEFFVCSTPFTIELCNRFSNFQVEGSFYFHLGLVSALFFNISSL